MDIKELKSLYAEKVNIMNHLREKQDSENNDVNMILHAYDLQAGSYRESYYHGHSKGKYIENEKVAMSVKEYNLKRCAEIARYLHKYNAHSILEVGVGEATTLAGLMKHFSSDTIAHGIDISFSRLAYGKLFLREQEITHASLAVGNLFSLPYQDSAFDIVYTYHTLEPNTGREKEALQELYRVAKKFVVLIEPSFDLGNKQTKENIEKHRYIKNITATAAELGYNVILHELFPIGTYKNQSAITILEKCKVLRSGNGIQAFACTKCKQVLEFDEHYFCSSCATIYPIIKGIPCLTDETRILGSKFNDPLLRQKLWKD